MRKHKSSSTEGSYRTHKCIPSCSPQVLHLLVCLAFAFPNFRITLNCLSPWFLTTSSWIVLADGKNTVPSQIMVLRCCPAILSSIWGLFFTLPRDLWFSKWMPILLKLSASSWASIPPAKMIFLWLLQNDASN